MPITFVKRLRPYKIDPSGADSDPYIAELVSELLPSALPSLSSYSRGMYSEERHIKSFLQFDVPEDDVLVHT